MECDGEGRGEEGGPAAGQAAGDRSGFAQSEYNGGEVARGGTERGWKGRGERRGGDWGGDTQTRSATERRAARGGERAAIEKAGGAGLQVECDGRESGEGGEVGCGIWWGLRRVASCLRRVYSGCTQTGNTWDCGRAAGAGIRWGQRRTHAYSTAWTGRFGLPVCSGVDWGQLSASDGTGPSATARAAEGARSARPCVVCHRGDVSCEVTVDSDGALWGRGTGALGRDGLGVGIGAPMMRVGLHWPDPERRTRTGRRSWSWFTWRAWPPTIRTT